MHGLAKPLSAHKPTSPSRLIPLCVPEIRGNEWRYLKECLDTGWVSTVGAFVERFEQSLAERLGARYAVATASGTSALHVALLVAGVQPGDEVLVSTLSFIAPANAIRYLGAWPVFVDAEPTTWQMDADQVVSFVERECRWQDGALWNRTTGRRVRAVLPVHILGHPVDLAPILDVAQRYELPVIEDATESLGARYRGTPVGRFGRLACFSFNGNKLLTTGGGGMIVTDDDQLAQRARHLTTQAKADALEYIHDEIGFNYRLTNIQAALGVAQIEQLDDYIAAKRQIAATYAAELRDLPGITLMPEASWAESVYWMYTVLIDDAQFGMDSRQLLRELSRRNIQTRPLWQPLHQSPAHPGMLTLGGSVAERLYRDALSLPCSVGLTREDQETVIAALGELAERGGSAR